MLISWFACTTVDPKWRPHKAIMKLSNAVVNVTDDFDNFFRVPHSRFVTSIFTSHTLLSVQFEHDIAKTIGKIQIEPENYSAFH